MVYESFVNAEIIERNKELLVPYIFTGNQFNILQKRIGGKELDSSEKYYYYTSISKKLKAIKALANINEEKAEETIFTSGDEGIIMQRKEAAKKILSKLSRNHKNMEMFIAGSFLYKKRYNDIDVFIFSKYDKDDYVDEYKKEKVHVNYLVPEAKDSLFFRSASNICISNFNIPKTPVKEKLTSENLISLYQELIIYILKNNDFKKELRSFILECYYFNENIVLSSAELNNIVERYLKNKQILNLVNKLIVHTLINHENKDEIRKTLKEYIKLNEEAKKETKYFKNLDIYIKTYNEVLEIGS